MPQEIKVKEFKTLAIWEKWLEKHHADAGGIWIRFFKKESGVSSLTYPEALDGALAYGWIDGQIKSLDEISWLRKFTSRRPGSLWSKRNISHVERLTAEGRMKAAGLREVEAAKADGRWSKAYEGGAQMQVPADFLKALAKDPHALAFFRSLNKANQYAIAWRLHTAAKPETRQRRMEKLLEMMQRGEKLH